MSAIQKRFAAELRAAEDNSYMDGVDLNKEVNALFDQYRGMIPLKVMVNMTKTAGIPVRLLH